MTQIHTLPDKTGILFQFFHMTISAVTYSSQSVVFIMGVNQIPGVEHLMKGPDPEHSSDVFLMVWLSFMVFLLHTSFSYPVPDLSSLNTLKLILML